MEKKKARLENWRRIQNSMSLHGYLVGEVHEHPSGKFYDGSEVRTSTIVIFDEENNTCETENTIYTLGKKSDARTS